MLVTLCLLLGECIGSFDESSYWMAIPASASIGTLASGYKEDNCIYVGIGILLSKMREDAGFVYVSRYQ